MGTGNKYNVKYNVEVISLYGQHKTRQEISDHFGIAAGTLLKWERKYPDFKDAVDKGKELAKCTAGRIQQKYTPSTPAKAQEFMSQGYSQKATAALLGITESTFNEWLNQYDEFRAAVDLGKGLCHVWWEQAGMDGMKGKIKNFNSSVWSLNVKNRFGYSEKQEISGDPDKPLNTNIQVEFIDTNNGDNDEDNK